VRIDAIFSTLKINPNHLIMKKLIPVLLCLVIFGSCKKSSNSCPSSAGSVYSSGAGDINVSVNYNYGFTTIEYGNNGFAKGSGTRVTLGSNGGVINGLNSGTYDIYYQGNCGGTSNSDWRGPLSVLVTGGGNCSAPYSLSYTVASSYVDMTWYYTSSTNVFQVQYGPTGFTIGHGDSAIVNSTDYRGGAFMGGTTYDFVVRAKCTDGTWSAWSSRQSFYATTNINECTAPSNVSFQNLGTGHVQFYWAGNGESTWEYNTSNDANTAPVTTTTTTAGSAQVIGVSSGVTFYFWVRAVCSSGSKTAWTKIPFMI
jgi:hypothetical protein